MALRLVARTGAEGLGQAMPTYDHLIERAAIMTTYLSGLCG
ncbi:hypothetical protein [Streptosporangium canum]